MKDENEFKTKDFYIACILRACHFSLIGLERNPSDIATFVFSNPDSSAERVIKDYWDRKLVVDGRSIIEAIYELKSRIKGRPNEGNIRD